jgi:ADP-ribose pyrophosphatase
MTIKPWVSTGSTEELVCRYGFMVFNETFIDPRSSKEVDHILTTTKSGLSPSIVFPVTEQNEVIAIDQFRFAANRILTEIPGGNPSSKKDSPEEVASRELLEETGFSARKVSFMGTLWFEPAKTRIPYHAVLATGCHLVNKQMLDSQEDIMVRLIDMEDWLEMINQGEITDSKTIACTHLALPRLGYSIVKT